MTGNRILSDADTANVGPSVLVPIDARNGFLNGKETAGLDGKILARRRPRGLSASRGMGTQRSAD